MTELTNGFLSRDGDEVYFETAGAPDAPVVVLGHGAGGNHAIWFQQVAEFARDYRVVTWDQRGFGLSTNNHGLANPRTATADLLAILDHLGVERAHVVGQSLGGWAAMGLALEHGDRVRSLVLADTIGGIPVEGWWKARPVVATRRTLRSPRARRTNSAFGIRSARTCISRSAACAAIPTPTPAAPSHLGRRHLHRRGLAQLRIPTLFIVGSVDDLFPPATIAAAAARAGARVETIAGAGHSPYFENPEAWNSLVAGFLREYR